eukprot:scaffold7566_cov122-Isochrysis_galbana.AAC.7
MTTIPMHRGRDSSSCGPEGGAGADAAARGNGGSRGEDGSIQGGVGGIRCPRCPKPQEKGHAAPSHE